MLGWGVVGTTNQPDVNEFLGYSHRVIVRPLDDIHLSKSSIVLRTKVKEVLPEDIIKILQSDFNEAIDEKDEKISQEDRQFLHIMKKEIKMVDGHYQMPLPLKENTSKLSSNRHLALKRLEQLKRKLEIFLQ